MLTGQAKTDYQREYMRKRRSNKKSSITLDPVRPKPESVRPDVITSDETSAKALEITKDVKDSNLAPDGHPVQHDNSMKVGYVPKEAV